MNTPPQRASDAVVLLTANAPATVFVGTGLAGMLAAAVAAALGHFALAGGVLGAAALAAFLGRTAGRSRGWPSRWMEYLCTVQDRIGDAPVMAGIAWWLRQGHSREAVVAVATTSFVFMSSYAIVRGLALGYRPPHALAGAPERAGVVAVGLLVPHALEPSLWIVCAIGAISFVRVAGAVWHQSAASERA